MKTKKKIKTMAAAACLFLLMTGTLRASVTTVDGTQFSNIHEVEEARLQIKGAALLRYLWFIEAYAGALYLPEGSDGTRALDDIPKHLVLEYRVSISAEDFGYATKEKIRESVSDDAFERLLPKIEALNRLYQSVRPGDRYALTYVPGSGTQLIYNGSPLGTIMGADFAKALFSIWIGENPIDKEFRDKLLGRL